MFSKGKLSARDKMEKAYFELLETTHYSKITVSDIIEKAGVSRTTFYRYYVDIFDMHEKVADRLSSTIVNTGLRRVFLEKNGDDIYEKLKEIVSSQDKYIKLISGENGSRYFFENIYNGIQKFVLPVLKFLPEETVFRIKFVSIAVIAVCVKDILEDRDHKTDFLGISKKIINLDKIRGGIYGK